MFQVVMAAAAAVVVMGVMTRLYRRYKLEDAGQEQIP